VAYCTTSDLKLGEIPIPAYLDPQKEVNDAADEIDSKIGFLYQTPVNVGVGSTVVRPAVLLLKRINASLASGRLLLALASPEENRNVHAYGWSLVKEAQAALDLIASGQLPLHGALPVEGVTEVAATAPLISNLDPESNVEAFYDRIANPSYIYFDNIRGPHLPDGFVR
jgi:hypothetical protein